MSFRISFAAVAAVLVVLAVAGCAPRLAMEDEGTVAGDWLREIVPEQPKPEDPHVYPEGSLLYDLWTCKGESDLGWIGVTQQFTDRDPYVVVVARTEFFEQAELGLEVGLELIGPRHQRIVASDRIRLWRNQDVGVFHHPRDLGRLGGWGEYKAVLLIDGVPRDEVAFRLDRVEDMARRDRSDRYRREAEAAMSGEPLEAKELLGDPEGGVPEGAPIPERKEIEIADPDSWYRYDFHNEEDKVIVFPKKVRRTWQENVARDLNYRIQYYIFL